MATGSQEGGRTVDHAPGSFVPPSPAELTARLPNLEVTEILGQGGMGVVYKGRQPFLDRIVPSRLRLGRCLNRTGFVGGLIPREDGAHGTTQQVLPRTA